MHPMGVFPQDVHEYVKAKPFTSSIDSTDDATKIFYVWHILFSIIPQMRYEDTLIELPGMEYIT